MKISNFFIYHLLTLHTGTNIAIAQEKPIVSTILSDKSSFYYTDFKQYPTLERNMPIGVFDSCNVGLTVMNAIVTLDLYNNKTHQKGKDGITDLK